MFNKILDTLQYLSNINLSFDATDKTSNKNDHPIQEWKQYNPAELNEVYKNYGKDWKFCRKCKLLDTGQEKIFELSH